MGLSRLFRGVTGFLTGGPLGALASLQDERDARHQYQRERRHRVADAEALAAETLKGTVRGARESGLHPLFALGGSGAIAPGPVLPGQSASGSTNMDALLRILSINAAKDFNDSQERLSRARVADNNVSNDTAQAGFDSMTQEYKKGEFQAYDKRHPEQSKNVKSPFHKFRYGGQTVWLPTEEISEFFDNIVTMGTMAYTYHGNKNVDWDKLWYYHKNGTMDGYKTPKQKLDDRLERAKKAFGERKRKEILKKLAPQIEMENKRLRLLRHRAG